MALDYIGLGFSLVMLVIYSITLFILFQIRIRVIEELSEAIIYFRIAIFILFFLRIQNILAKANLLIVPYSQELLALFLALILMMGFFSLYKSVANFTDRQNKKISSTSRKIKSRNKLK